MTAPDPNDPLDRLAESVSDGTRVDWDRVQSEPRLDSDTTGALKDLERIAEFSRALQRTHSVGPGPSASGTGERWGDLLLLELIGAGAKGEVWRAWDSALQREVALKFLQASKTAPGSDPQAELLSEARAVARVRHRGVVAIYGIAERDGRAGMWMECLQGPTLAREIERVGALPVARVADIGLQLCSALEALESKGLVHRDIKPANIVLEGDRVVLTDFGLGWRPAVAEAEGSRMSGTPFFMAPEILAGEGASARSDLYALGVTLWWALTGKAPFRAATLSELREETARGPGERLTAIRPDAPQGLVKAIEWAMRPAAAERPASAAALAGALRPAVEQIVAKDRMLARGHLARWGTVGIVVAVALVALVLALRTHTPFGSEHRGVPMTAWHLHRLPISEEAMESGGGAGVISPDGTKAAYLPDSTTISVLSLASSDSRTIDHLEPNDGIYVDVNWSSDGSKLVTTRCDPAGNVSVALLDVVTGQRDVLARLGDIGVAQAYDVRVSLSPNGAWLAVRRDYRPRTGSYTQIDLLDVHAGVERTLVRAAPSHVGVPSWSPNSERIAYVLEKGNREYSRIETCDLRGMRATVLEDSAGGLMPNMPVPSICWLADGRIVYALKPIRQGEPGDADLWIVPADPRSGRRSGPPELLYSMPGADLRWPTASADGRHIAFFAVRLDQAVRFIGTDSQPRFRNLTGRAQLMGLDAPVWSRDGLGLFVRSNESPGSIGRVRLSDGRYEPLVSLSSPRDLPLAVSGDGELLCGISSRLVALPTAGGAPRVIADSFDGTVLCASASSQCIAIEHVANELVVRDFDGHSGLGRVRFRYPVQGMEERLRPKAALSPDGNRIALLRPDATGFVILDAMSGRQLGRIDFPEPSFPQSAQWSKDGATLYVSGWGTLAQYWIAHVGGHGVDRLVWQTDNVAPRGIALSPDGTTLAFGSVLLSGEVWTIDRP